MPDEIIQISEGTHKSLKPIYIFFHICCIGNYEEVVNEIVDSIIESGLYNKCDKVFCYTLGVPSTLLTDKLSEFSKFEITHSSNNIKEVEYPTLLALENFCINKDCYLMYVHTKGVSAPDDVNKKAGREMMIQKVIAEHQTCISMLNNGFDIVGCRWKEKQGFVPEHYSGNFWWATSKHVSALPSLKEIQGKAKNRMSFNGYRVECEFWIGRANNKKVGVNGGFNKEFG